MGFVSNEPYTANHNSEKRICTDTTQWLWRSTAKQVGLNESVNHDHYSAKMLQEKSSGEKGDDIIKS